MVSIKETREWAAMALGNDEVSALIGGIRCGEYVTRLLDPSPITPERLKERGEIVRQDWYRFGIAEVIRTAEGWCVCRVNCRPGVTVTSMGELELELARIELAREVQETSNADAE